MTPLVTHSLFWVSAFMAALAQAALLRSAAGARAANERAAYTARELAWAVIPAIGLGALFVAAWMRLPPIAG